MTGWLAIDATPPDAAIVLPDPERRVCMGDSLGYEATAAGGVPPLSYLWDIPGGTPANPTILMPSVTLAVLGPSYHSFTVTDSSAPTPLQNTALPLGPVMVGTATGNPNTEYPNLRVKIRVKSPGGAWKDLTRATAAAGDTEHVLRVTWPMRLLEERN